MNKVTELVLQKIYDITINISILYTTLEKLELENKQQTTEYQNTIDSLNKTINEEKEYYDYFHKDFDQLYSVGLWLAEELYEIRHNDIYDLAIKQKQVDLSHFRVMFKMSKLIDKDIGYMNNYDYENYINLLNEVDLNTTSIYLLDMIPKLNNSTIIRIASYLEVLINKETNYKIKEYFIKARLILSYLDENLETQYLNNNFIKTDNIFNQEIENNNKKINEALDNNIKNLYGKNLLNKVIYYFNNLNEEAFNSSTVYKESLLYNIILITSLLYISDNEMEEDYIINLIQDNEILEVFLKNAVKLLDEFKLRANSDLNNNNNTKAK